MIEIGSITDDFRDLYTFCAFFGIKYQTLSEWAGFHICGVHIPMKKREYLALEGIMKYLKGRLK